MSEKEKGDHSVTLMCLSNKRNKGATLKVH